MHPKKALVINIIIFSVILVLHIFRSLLNWPALIGGVSLPLWASYVAIIALLLLIYLNYKAFKKA